MAHNVGMEQHIKNVHYTHHIVDLHGVPPFARDASVFKALVSDRSALIRAADSMASAPIAREISVFRFVCTNASAGSKGC